MSAGESGPQYRCPKCDYDVSRTLADAIETCPECGGTVTYALCLVAQPRNPWKRRLVLIGPGVGWALLLAGLFAGGAPFPGVTFGVVWGLSVAALMAYARAEGTRRGDGPIERMMRAFALVVINILVFCVVCGVGLSFIA